MAPTPTVSGERPHQKFPVGLIAHTKEGQAKALIAQGRVSVPDPASTDLPPAVAPVSLDKFELSVGGTNAPDVLGTTEEGSPADPPSRMPPAIAGPNGAPAQAPTDVRSPSPGFTVQRPPNSHDPTRPRQYSHSATSVSFPSSGARPVRAPSPGRESPARYPSTFDVLTRTVPFPSGRPEALQGLRPSCRALQVCTTPSEMLWDVDNLTYINRGSTSVVFHGIWQGAEVAVKFMLANFNEHSASVREALLGSELSHPNVVRCFTARCCTLKEDFLEAQHLDAVNIVDAQRALIDTTAANLPKSLFRDSFDSEDGFGPPPSSMMMLQLARSTTPSLSRHGSQAGSTSGTPSAPQSDSSATLFAPPTPGHSSNLQRDASPRPASRGRRSAALRANMRSPWAGDLTWGSVLKTLVAVPGQVLTMIISEYCDMGNLSTAIYDKRVFDMGKVMSTSETACIPLRALLRTAVDASLGLHHLHQAGIIHGDVKPGNILLIGARSDRRGFRAKLTDLGTARVTPMSSHLLGGSCPTAVAKPGEPPVSNDILLTTTDKGTIPYMAPEHFAGILVEASDVYSLGVVIWEMCHGCAPFGGASEAEVTQGVVTGRLQLTWSATMPHGLADLVAMCTQHAPAKRPSTSEILSRLAVIEAQLREDIRCIRQPDTAQPSPVQMPVFSGQPVPPKPGEPMRPVNAPRLVIPPLRTAAHEHLRTQQQVVQQQTILQQLQKQLHNQQLQLLRLTAGTPLAIPPVADTNQTHWPQLPPLLRAPKHVTPQGSENTDGDGEAQQHGAQIPPRVVDDPYRVQHLNTGAVSMLLQRGAHIAMQNVRELNPNLPAGVPLSSEAQAQPAGLVSPRSSAADGKGGSQGISLVHDEYEVVVKGLEVKWVRKKVVTKVPGRQQEGQVGTSSAVPLAPASPPTPPAPVVEPDATL